MHSGLNVSGLGHLAGYCGSCVREWQLGISHIGFGPDSSGDTIRFAASSSAALFMNV
jgi:hypothetical protein